MPSGCSMRNAARGSLIMASGDATKCLPGVRGRRRDGFSAAVTAKLEGASADWIAREEVLGSRQRTGPGNHRPRDH